MENEDRERFIQMETTPSASEPLSALPEAWENIGSYRVRRLPNLWLGDFDDCCEGLFGGSVQ